MAYVGPQIGEPAWAAPLDLPWADDDPRPLAAVGFSTSFQNHVGVLQRVIDAMASLPMRGVVTLGDTIAPEELRAPENVVLLHSAPHDALMRQANMVVTHGGHGTVMRALAHGRPMLVIPHGRDQNDNAIRVTERGAGLSLPANASVEAIADALIALKVVPSFAANARLLGEKIATEAKDSPIVQELEALAAESNGSSDGRRVA
jgi:UDP:flavonoid glycosyltransferase YjiC (YdhE family)